MGPDSSRAAVAEELAAHDRALDDRGVELWLGAEPTFTDASSEDPEWLFEALGEAKQRRAGRMSAALANRMPGAVMLRPAGRPYGGEAQPRWCFGVYARRDGEPLWGAACDPLQSDTVRRAVSPEVAARHLQAAMAAVGWKTRMLRVAHALPMRIAFAGHARGTTLDGLADAEMGRESLHASEVAGAELLDELAVRGSGLLLLGTVRDALSAHRVLRIELPAIPDAAAYQRLLRVLGEGLAAARIRDVVIAGFPPPTDDSVAWTTFTPDPAVVEVNMAPAACAAEFHRAALLVQELALGEGLSPARLHYNGLETDSGGGGQITLGGARPESSPFLLEQDLLPGLVRYFNRHPALSYYWASELAGAASQGPRADEGLRQTFRELDLTLAMLEASPAPSPEILQRALGPFLTDASGNSHRAELNIEKLWSDGLGARGRQGLVEFRALRMPREPAVLSAVGALLRALVARVASSAVHGALVDWGDRLQDKYSLPFYLRADLRAVLRDLHAHGLGLGPTLEALLLDDDFRRIADVALPDGVLTLSRAVEFWPLMGDVASQEQGGARLVDASTARVELRLHAGGARASPQRWSLSAAGVELPVHAEHDDRGACLVSGVRYRTFVPAFGLHPGLGAQAPLELRLAHPRHGHWQLTLHEWRPAGGAYEGLPADPEAARARRTERCVLVRCAPPEAPPGPPPDAARGEHVLDLRWLAPGVGRRG